MHYITLDLEWNQAYAEKALAVQKRLSLRLRGEVIQIGAVKLDSNMNICGSYQVIVKPKFFKRLHRHVSKLTGITQEQIDMGTGIEFAAERFKRWCGNDFAFLTWGPDDIPMLKENFVANGMATDWLSRTYDLQKIFNKQTDGLSKQRSLEYAMEHFEIPMTLPAHDALNDAYFTALVAQKLDVKSGVKSYSEYGGDTIYESVFGDADAGDDGYVAIDEIFDDAKIKRPRCPICNSHLTMREKALHSKGQRYTYLYDCAKHGQMMFVYKLHKNFNDTWRAKLTVSPATEKRIGDFKEGLALANQRRKTTRRKNPRRRTTEYK